MEYMFELMNVGWVDADRNVTLGNVVLFSACHQANEYNTRSTMNSTFSRRVFSLNVHRDVNECSLVHLSVVWTTVVWRM